MKGGNMKKSSCKIVLLAVLSAMAANVVRSEGAPCKVRLGIEGRITVDRDIGIGLMMADKGWGGPGFRFANKKWKFNDFASGAVEFDITHGNETDLAAQGLISIAETKDGKALISGSIYAQKEYEIAESAISIDLPANRFAGGTYETSDGKRRVFPEKNNELHLFSGSVDSIVLRPKTGNSIKLEFPCTAHVHLQDSRRWGNNFTMRLTMGGEVIRKKEKRSRYFLLGSENGLEIAKSEMLKIVESDEWIKLDYRKNIAKDSILDFSKMGLQDAPAGKYGRLKAVGNHFEFEKLPGVKQRFYGANLCFEANFPEHEFADEIIARLTRFGYNTIRVHHHDIVMVRGSKDALSLNPEWMDKVDYLLAKAYENGIYVTTDLYTARRIEWRTLGIDRDGTIPPQVYKALVATDDAAFRNWTVFASNMLCHVNKYTGRRYADEPGLPLISLVNENAINWCWQQVKMEKPIQKAWKEFLQKRRAIDKDYAKGVSERANEIDGSEGNSVYAEFLADTERNFMIKARAFLKSIGVKALITNQNCAGHTKPMDEVREEYYDYVDDHYYIDHPHFLAKSWSLPSKCANVNPVQSSSLPLPGFGMKRNCNHPYAITEWNFSGPGMYRGIGGIMTGAAGALQDWDGLWRFAYSHGLDNMREGKGVPGYFDVAADPLMQASDRASVLLFLRRDMPVLPSGQMIKDIPDHPNFTLDKANGNMTLRTDRTAGGFAMKGILDAGAIRFDVGEVPATVWASSIDGKAITKSNRILVTHLTDVQANGNLYTDDTKKVILKWGNGGTLIRNGSARIALKLDKAGEFSVWAIDTAGNRIEKIPSKADGNRLAFIANIKGKNGATILYEVTR